MFTSNFFSNEYQFGDLTLKKLSLYFANQLLKNWGSDPKTFETLSCNPVDTIEKVTSMIEKSIILFQHNQLFRFAIFHNNHVVGVVSLTPRENNDSIEIGLSIGSKFWGKGIATNTINFFTTLLHNEKKSLSIFATIRENNLGSLRAFQKADFYLQSKVRRKYIYGNDCSFPNEKSFYLTKKVI